MGLLERLRRLAGGDATGESAPDAEASRLIEEGNALEDAGRTAEALQRYDAALRVAPQSARAHMNRGNALLAQGDVEGAVASYGRAVEIDPDFAPAHYNLGNAHARAGRFEPAVAAYGRAIALRPAFADAHVALAALHEAAGRVQDAVAGYRRALALDPEKAGVHVNLANALRAAGELDEAVACGQRALAIEPRRAEAHWSLGRSWQAQGRLQEAMASFRRAVACAPERADLHVELGLALQQIGMFEEALRCYRAALAIEPAHADALSNAGTALLRLGRRDEAIASQRQAVAARPGYAAAHFNLANALRDSGRPLEAIASYADALAAEPDFISALVGLGDVQKDLGRFDDAVASFRRALAVDPDFQEAHGSLLFCLAHDDATDPHALFAEHRAFGDRLEAPFRASWPAHRNVREPERCLQIGFVSADLRAHPVAYFLEPVLQRLAGCAGLSLHAYAGHAGDDAVTRRLQPHFRFWHPIAGMPDTALATRIAVDAIDVLIDLSGHTSGNRLSVFARKPAPIQASWLGYPGTTGLTAMDYFFADPYLLPLAEFADQFTEKLVHLPSLAPFLPEPAAPAVNALPALGAGHLTFGSFNRPSKLRPAVIALWARLLRAVPDARMLLAAMPEDGGHEPLAAQFAREGIARERLEFHVRCDMARYLALHHRVDVCLDTFPYSGGTTTAHALWMGVPTLTLAGGTPAGRQGAAILGQVGLPDFVATDAAEFVRKGVAIAADRGSLAALRSGLRARWSAAPSGKPEAIAAAVERALRIMWRRWCAGSPPAAFTVQ